MATWTDKNGARRYKSPGHVPYLRQRRGRYLVRVAVPRDLQHRFGKAQERYLGTSDAREARRKAPVAVAKIMAKLERARLGSLTANEIADIGHAELQRTHRYLASDPFEGPDAVADWLFVNHKADGTRDYSTVEPKARAIIEQIGAEVTEESVRSVSDAIINAAFTAQELWRRNIQPPAHTVSRRMDPPANGEGGMLISELLEAWLYERKPPKKTENEWRRAVRRWQELHGDTSIRSITKEQVSEYKDALLRAPARPKHKMRELPLPRLIEAARAQGNYQATGATAVNKTITAIRSILGWAVANGRLEINPASNVKAIAPRRKSDENRRPFTVPELQTVLVAASTEKRKADRWLPIVAAFTGARQPSALATARRLTGVAKMSKHGLGGTEWPEIA